MSYENIDDNGRIVKCRKPHICEWCGEVIEKDDKAVVRKYKFDGDFNSSRMHLECWKALNSSLPDMWDGSFEAYEQKRGHLIHEGPIV